MSKYSKYNVHCSRIVHHRPAAAKVQLFLASESHLLAQLPIEPELEQLYQNLEISSELVSLTAEGYSVVVILI